MHELTPDTDCFIMLHNNVAAKFNLKERVFKVIQSNYLPYCLRDWDTSESELIDTLRDWLYSRALDMSRTNANIILGSANMPTRLRFNEKVNLSLRCNALSFSDNYWVKGCTDTRDFEEVCLRNHPLSEVSYAVAISGRNVSATAEELKSDLMTGGTFPKFWRRYNGKIELCKFNKTGVEVAAEVYASKLLRQLGAECVEYREELIYNRDASVCNLINSDTVSLVEAWQIKDWCQHTRKPLSEVLLSYTRKRDFANLVIGNYLVANTDVHDGNWGFMVNDSGDIIQLAPIYDLNLSIVADTFKTNIDDLMFDPLGCRYFEAVTRFVKYSDLDLSLADETPRLLKLRKLLEETV